MVNRSCWIATAVLTLSVTSASLAQWADVKGQVVYTGQQIPPPNVLKVTKDSNHCLSKGPLNSDAILVDAKSLGVKNVMVWLAPINGKMPIHKDLEAIPKETAVIDQPCCMFVPRVTMIRQGQMLEIKNTAPVSHNARIIGSPTVNGTINQTIPPGQSITKTLKAERMPILLNCDIHGWMGGLICVFDHPYFALTNADGAFIIKNAPVGQFRLFVKHEVKGWAHKPESPNNWKNGQLIEIRAGGTDLGKIGIKSFVD